MNTESKGALSLRKHAEQIDQAMFMSSNKITLEVRRSGGPVVHQRGDHRCRYCLVVPLLPATHPIEELAMFVGYPGESLTKLIRRYRSNDGGRGSLQPYAPE